MEIISTASARFARFDDTTLTILRGLFNAGQALNLPSLVITSGTDGTHSGPADPHHQGHAFDVRSHDFPSADAKATFVATVQRLLGDEFYIFLEAPHTPNEHFHVQVRRGHAFSGVVPVGLRRSA